MIKKVYSLTLMSTLLAGMLAGSSQAADKVVVIPLNSSAAVVGDATPGDVLAGKTFSGDAGVGVTGTMEDNGAVEITPNSTSQQPIPSGYHNGDGFVGKTSGLVSTGDAVAADVLNPKTFSNATATGITGGMADNGAVIITPSNSPQFIPSGYHDGNGFVGATSAQGCTGNAVAADVLNPKTFSNEFETGIIGGMVNVGKQDITPGIASQTIIEGFHDGSGSVAGDTDLTPANIKSGTTIFGVSGDSNVVDTSSGDAVAGEIAIGKVAWVDGAQLTGTVYPAPVERTAQTPTVPIAAPVGTDGDLQKGIAWPDPRFTDNSNGTVTDNLTGLTWLKNSNCTDTVGAVDKSAGTLIWANALIWSNNLADGDCGLTDSSSAGDWRLPNIKELQSLIAYQYFNPALSDAAGTAKWADGDAFTNVEAAESLHWSSSTYARTITSAWAVSLDNGFVRHADKTIGSYSVWPVRD